MLSLISSMMVGFAIFFTIFVAEMMITKKAEWFLSLAIGTVMGVIYYYAPEVPFWMAILFILACLAVVGYILVFWKKNGFRVREIIPLAIAIGFIGFGPLRASIIDAIATSGAKISRTKEMHVIQAFRDLIPALIVTASVGYMCINLFFDRVKHNQRKIINGTLAILATVAMVIAMASEAFWLVDWPKDVTVRRTTALLLDTETVEAAIWSPSVPTTEAPTTEVPTTEAPTTVEESTTEESTTEEPTTVEESTTEEMLEEETTEEETYLPFEMYEKPEIPAWITLHNDPLIWDDDPWNDYNFGTSPVEDSEFMELFSEKYPELTSSTLQFIAENEDKILENPKVANWAAEELKKDFLVRMSENPFTGAAWLAWFDSILGSRYMGEFYSQCNEQWDAAINQAAREFMADKSQYWKTLKAFSRGYLENPLTRVELRKAEVMDDQMYLNPFTVDGIPDVIVLETKDHQGLFLVFIFTIKHQEFEVPFRINCGYQPTDVHEILHIEPLPEPPEPEKLPPVEAPTTTVPQTTPAPTEPQTTQAPPPPTTAAPPTTEAPTPAPTVPPTTPAPTEPQTTPAPTKDPSKGVQGEPVAPNDNPGPGEYTPPATKSGEGQLEPETISSKDEAISGNSSTNQTSYDEYRARMSELESINAAAQQQTPAPTPAPTVAPTQPAPTQAPATQAPTEAPTPAPTQAPPTTHVDDNANVGNGGDPIDVATPTQPPAQIAPTGNDPVATPETISTQPAGAWGGPPD